MQLADGTSLDEAKAAVLGELPRDARVVWFKVLDSCAEEQLQSAILGKALSGPFGDPTGGVFVYISTLGQDGSMGYHPTSLNRVVTGLGAYAKPSDAPGC